LNTCRPSAEAFNRRAALPVAAGPKTAYSLTIGTNKAVREVFEMYYSSGNYEAFARPVKPEGVDHKSAYLIGTGLAALSAACYLVRDAQMPGSHIHISKRTPSPAAPATATSTKYRLRHARRARDGQPLRCHVGSVPLHPVH
jgi:hypothetical protein